MTRLARAHAAMFLFVAASSCGPAEDADVTAPAPSAEIGWVEIPAQDYAIAGRALHASSARSFYALVPGRCAAPRPLFVVTGGGPGAAVLFPLGFGLGPRVIRVGDAGLASVESNPDAFTDLGDQLYIDARGSGLSYLLSQTPDQKDARTAELSLGSFNVLRDAADVLWILCDVLDRRTDIGRAGVYFVTESYGGLRTSAMLDRVLRGGANASFPDLDARLPKLLPAGALRGQILLEPSIASARQHRVSGELLRAAGSVLDRVAAETGLPFTRCDGASPACDPYADAMLYLSKAGRSPYDYAVAADWLDRRLSLVQAAGTISTALAALLGVDVDALRTALATRSPLAFRFGDLGVEPWRSRGDLGALPEYDAYFSSLAMAVLSAVSTSDAAPLGVDRSSDAYGAMFLDNVRSVPTFVSRATRDLNSYGPALAPVLASYVERLRGATEVAMGIELEYLDGARVTITSPVYEGSHAVLESAAAALHADVARFVGP